jgi:hypothetical protein
MTISDMERQARINTITMGGVIKWQQNNYKF